MGVLNLLNLVNQGIAGFWAKNNDGPATGAFEITPDDGADLDQVARVLYCAVTGVVRVTMLEGQVFDYTVTEVGVQPLTVIKVWATGTDLAFATPGNLVGLT